MANIIPIEDAVKYMKDAATASYGKKGEKVVAMNHAAIDRGVTDVKEIKIDLPGSADAQALIPTEFLGQADDPLHHRVRAFPGKGGSLPEFQDLGGFVYQPGFEGGAADIN